MLIKTENNALPNSKKGILNKLPENLKCKHINHFKLSPCFDSSTVIYSNIEIQFLTAALYSYNDSSMRFEYTPPAGLSHMECLALPTVQVLPSIFSDITVLTDNEKIYQFYVKGLLDKAEVAYALLRKAQTVDMSIWSCFKGNNSPELVYPAIAPTTYELVRESQYIDFASLRKDILSNGFFSFLLTQCIRNHMLYIVPLKGWQLDEIENSKYLNILPQIFQKVWFCGFGDDWRSDSLIVSQPLNTIITGPLQIPP